MPREAPKIPGLRAALVDLTAMRCCRLPRAANLRDGGRWNGSRARQFRRGLSAARDDPDFDAPVFGVLVGFLDPLARPFLHVGGGTAERGTRRGGLIRTRVLRH